MMNKLAVFFCLLMITLSVNAQDSGWQAFMQRQSMDWDTLGQDYYSGAILGNGLLGVNVYRPEEKTIHFDVGRSDVVDNRIAQYPNANKLFTRARLPIGYFALTTKGNIKSSSVKLDILTAKATGKIITDEGEIDFTAYVSAVKEAIVIDLKGSGSEKNPSLQFMPAVSISPRMLQGHIKEKPENFPPNPPAEKLNVDGYTIYHQKLVNGGGYATAYKTLPEKDNLKTIVSIGYDEYNNKDELGEAKANLNAIQNDKTDFAKHEKWWRDYYQKSFVSLPDKRMETFYWAQIYKFGSLTRPGKPMIDLVGPWTNPTPWTAIWWNLNVQLTYSPLFAANRIELAQPLFDALNKNLPNLIKNAPPVWQSDSATIGRSSSYDLISNVTDADVEAGTVESANLVWTLFYYYEYYLYTGDEQTLKNKVLPLLKKSANFMIHLLQKDERGIYHLRMSHSPEYKNAVDTNYGLASLRWALKTLIETDAKFKLNDKDSKKWREILDNLAEYPKDETGFMIGKDVALTSSHRHYSHLLMIYPYQMVNSEQKGNRQIIEKSLAHWLSLKGALQGYTFTGSASMYAGMGDGNKAYDLLNQLFDKYIQPNTLYKESGPVIETPLAAVASIQEMLLQSWGGKIRVFPAVPSSWQNAAFDRLLAAGAFEVSAKMENGKTVFIKIKSKTGGQCTIQTTMKPAKIQTANGKNVKAEQTDFEGKQLITFQTKPGEIIELSADKNTDKKFAPVAGTEFKDWHWGVNKIER